MIQKPSKLAGFLYIDRCCEGVDWSRPGDDEEFIGIPHGWYEVGAMGCIEIHKGNKLLYAVNLAEVACIEFADEANDGK